VSFLVVRAAENRQAWASSAVTQARTLPAVVRREPLVEQSREAYAAALGAARRRNGFNVFAPGSRWGAWAARVLTKAYPAAYPAAAAAAESVAAAREALEGAVKEAQRAIVKRTHVFLSTVDSAHIVGFILEQRPVDAIVLDEAGAVPIWKMPILTALAPEAIVM
jgi:hypothetical protein